MSPQPPMPDPEKVKQTVADSRRRRLEMEVVGLELQEVIARLEQHSRQQRSQRLKQVLNCDSPESQPSEQNPTEFLNLPH